MSGWQSKALSIPMSCSELPEIATWICITSYPPFSKMYNQSDEIIMDTSDEMLNHLL